jgi:hypothetical protein
MANLKFQNMESAICDVKFRVLARTRYSRWAPCSLFQLRNPDESSHHDLKVFVVFVYGLVYRRLLAATYPS